MARIGIESAAAEYRADDHVGAGGAGGGAAHPPVSSTGPRGAPRPPPLSARAAPPPRGPDPCPPAPPAPKNGGAGGGPPPGAGENRGACGRFLVVPGTGGGVRALPGWPPPRRSDVADGLSHRLEHRLGRLE